MMSSLVEVTMTARLACGQLTVRLLVKGLMVLHSLMPLNDFVLVQPAVHSVISAVVREVFSFCLSSLDSEPEDLSVSFSAHELPLPCISTSATAQSKSLDFKGLVVYKMSSIKPISVSCLAGHLQLTNFDCNALAFCLCPFEVTSTVLQSQEARC